MAAEPIALARRRDHLQLIKCGAAGEMAEIEQRDSEREPAVAVPLVYFQMLKGDARAAAFLAQVLYHQKYKGVDGWFYHTVAQWEDELGFSDEAEARCCRTLAAYGLETKVKTIDRTPKKHYHIDVEKLQERISDHRHLRESRKCKEQKPHATHPRQEENTPTDIYGKAVSADISGNAVGDTTGKTVNVTSVEAVSGLTGKPENMVKEIDLKEINDQEMEANASFGDGANAPLARERKSRTSPKKKNKPRVRDPDPYWDALVALCGPAEGRETVYGRIAQDIKDMGGTPGDIPIRAANWYRLFPGATRTIFSIRKFWYELATEAVDAELSRKAAEQPNGGKRNGTATNGQRATGIAQPATQHHKSNRSDIF